MAGQQTSFDSQDAENLLKDLQDINDDLRHEWSKVLNQWSNLKSVWRDVQFDRFEPLFEKFQTAYHEAEKECDQYTTFMKEQIRINENKKEKLAGFLKDF
jgi:hypothetical protein